MEAKTETRSRGNTVKFLVGSLLSLAILVGIGLKVDLAAIHASFARVDYWWTVPMIATYIAGFVVRGVRSQLVLSGITTIDLAAATEGVFIGYMGNSVLPARAGELMRTFFVANSSATSRTSVLGTLIVERIFDGLAILGILGLTLLCSANIDAGKYHVVQRVLGIGFLLFGVLAAVLVIGARHRPFFEDLSTRLLSFLPDSLEQKAKSLLAKLLDSVTPLSRNNSLLLILAFSFLVWCVEGLVFLFGLVAFRHAGSFATAYLTMALVNLALILPSAPAGIGVFQAGVLLAFSVFGLPAELALAYSFLVQAVMIIPIVLIGLMILNMRGLSFGAVRKIE